MTEKRCGWVNLNNSLYLQYHDEEWGVPVHDDRKLFEMLILEGAQAGLSWELILKKRENYRKAFDYFDPSLVAAFGENKILELLDNPGIVRNRLKLRSAVKNAGVFLEIQREFGSFDRYLWHWVKGKPLVNQWESIMDVPCFSPLSDALSRDLKKRGMSFVGTKIIYSFLQAVGVINDHEIGCFRYREV